jgi:hypothetical protein
MDVQALAEQYRDKTDTELLRLALAPEHLIPDARMALAGELTRRGIESASHLDAARQEENELNADNDRSIGKLGFIAPFGVGRMRFGKRDRLYDPETGLERFKTTVFVVLFWFPLIPTGTYMVERNPTLPDIVVGLEKLPLDWEQILGVWVVAAGSIVGFLWLIRLASSDTVGRLLHWFWR